VHEEQLSRAEAAKSKIDAASALKPTPAPKPTPVVSAGEQKAASPQQAAALQKLQDSLAKIADQQNEVAEKETDLRAENILARPPLLATIRTRLAQIDALLLPLEKTGPATIAASPAAGQAALRKSLQAAIDRQSRLQDNEQPQRGNTR